MEKSKTLEINKKELEELVASINEKVDVYIKSLKRKSSEEILNGSILEAQKIINQILPIETEFQKLDAAHTSFLSILQNNEMKLTANSTKNKSPNEELEHLDLSEMDFTPQEYYRVPILKALIYLGGNAKLSEVAGFIEKEMRDKFKKGDNEKGTNGFDKLWIEMISREKESMVNEELISEDKKGEQWEIIQNGINYLSQHSN